MCTHSPDPSVQDVYKTPFYAKSAGHVTRPYQGISLPKCKYPGNEVDNTKDSREQIRSWKTGFKPVFHLRISSREANLLLFELKGID